MFLLCQMLGSRSEKRNTCFTGTTVVLTYVANAWPGKVAAAARGTEDSHGLLWLEHALAEENWNTFLALATYCSGAPLSWLQLAPGPERTGAERDSLDTDSTALSCPPLQGLEFQPD